MKNRTMGLLVTIFALTGASIYADHHCGCSHKSRQKTVNYTSNNKRYAHANYKADYSTDHNMNHHQNQGLVGGPVNAAENVTGDAIGVAEAPLEMLGF